MEKLEKISSGKTLGDGSEQIGLSDNLRDMKAIAFKQNYAESIPSKGDSASNNYECTMSTCHCATW